MVDSYFSKRTKYVQVIKKKATKKLEKNEGLFKADKTQMNKSKMDDIDKPPSRAKECVCMVYFAAAALGRE